MKWKIEPRFSLNAMTQQPETNYMVRRRHWGRWEDVQQFVTKPEAQTFIKVEKLLAAGNKGR